VRRLLREDREHIIKTMLDQGRLTADDAFDIAKDRVIFDEEADKRAVIKRVVQSVMRSIRLQTGIKGRVCFNLKAAESVYVNIEKTESLDDLDLIEKQLNKQYFGLMDAKQRIEHRREIILGQITLDEVFAVTEQS
jgi:hypothetical protein